MTKRSLLEHPVHLGLGAAAYPEPPFTGMAWYEDYGRRHADDGAEGRLVSMHRFGASWPTWEMHPEGHELVVCVEGTITLIQEAPDGRTERVELNPGEYAINLPGHWHTADIEGGATALFITAGKGTEVRPR